jgi:DNA-binding response OmpR family regulator
MKILIVEDEKELASSIKEYLEQDNFLCETAGTYDEALEKLELYKYECAVVDIMLPDGSGLELVEHFKRIHSSTGIIIASAKNALDDRLKGLELGADDYLTKPFHLSELSARIKSIIRRRNFDGEKNVVLEDIKILPDERRVFINKEEIDLTGKEYDLLLYFFANKNRVLTREAIAENLVGDDADLMDSFNFIYTHIKNLRKKIIRAGGKDRIKTIYSIGYKFVTE